MLGFESAHHPVDGSMEIAIDAARDHGGAPGEVRGQGSGGGSTTPSADGQAFLAAPYLRDNFVALGVLSDTFETAITWDRFEFHARVMTPRARQSPRHPVRPRAAMEPGG